MKNYMATESITCLTLAIVNVLFRMSHARGKAEAAEGVAQKAMEECRLARIAAKELSPSFHIYGNGEWTSDAVGKRVSFSYHQRDSCIMWRLFTTELCDIKNMSILRIILKPNILIY